MSDAKTTIIEVHHCGSNYFAEAEGAGPIILCEAFVRPLVAGEELPATLFVMISSAPPEYEHWARVKVTGQYPEPNPVIIDSLSDNHPFIAYKVNRRRFPLFAGGTVSVYPALFKKLSDGDYIWVSEEPGVSKQEQLSEKLAHATAQVESVGPRIGAFAGGNCSEEAVVRETRKLIESLESKLKALELRWSKKKPEQPGEYWVKKGDVTWTTKVILDRGGRLSIRSGHSWLSLDLYAEVWFAGPIQLPVD